MLLHFRRLGIYLERKAHRNHHVVGPCVLYAFTVGYLFASFHSFVIIRILLMLIGPQRYVVITLASARAAREVSARGALPTSCVSTPPSTARSHSNTPYGPFVEYTPLFSMMASATGIPAHINGGHDASEDEPLLGQRGDASQMSGQPLWYNLWLGMSFWC
jgi:hypothetical protein